MIKGQAWLLLYVDDILIFSKNMEMVDQAKDMLVQRFKMHEEDMSKYLGINVSLEPGMAKLSPPALRRIRSRGGTRSQRSSRAIQVPIVRMSTTMQLTGADLSHISHTIHPCIRQGAIYRDPRGPYGGGYHQATSSAVCHVKLLNHNGN